MFLDLNTFETVIDSTPLVSIDLIVRNSAGEVLLGKRINKPAQGYWFVPGGRVYKNEQINIALARIAKSELGIEDTPIQQAQFKGVYQHFYDDSFVSNAISTHYIVLAYELTIESVALNIDQHSEYAWLNVETLLQNSAVHQYTKDYF